MPKYLFTSDTLGVIVETELDPAKYLEEAKTGYCYSLYGMSTDEQAKRSLMIPLGSEIKVELLDG